MAPSSVARRGDGAAASASCLPIILLLLVQRLSLASAQDDGDADESELDDEEIEASRTVLFPWFAEALGVVVFYLTTRYVLILPYTGIMFILGVFCGVGATRLQSDDHLTQSLAQWSGINYEVLLLIFLPGLVFNDSFGMDVHLFGLAIWQCLMYAFPMVLAGTCLTALVGYYVFPFSWSFNLAMTFGSILSATDPVAVAALLEEVGAPPRLQIHIGGESLLNDGSAMVFYTIFSALFLSELGIPGVGETISTGQGFALFFRMSFGGAAIGMAFSLGLVLILYLLNRRLTGAENVVQVVSTITTAYLCYYTADSVCGTSGVIATLSCGVLAQAFGSAMINDTEMMSSFWGLVEQLLNTLLFTLGGLVFGSVISNYGEREGFWTASDWGYLILLWVLLHAIRFLLVFSFYPCTVRLGLSTNWKECFFLSYGGLRGAVGISLAIALDNSTWSVTDDETYRRNTTQLFGMVGGTAFLTLVINGSTAGPLLKKLGLVKSTTTRKKVLQLFKKDLYDNTVKDLLSLLSDERFACVDFAHVRHHVNLSENDGDLLRRLKEQGPPNSPAYEEKDVDAVLSALRSAYITDDEEGAAETGDDGVETGDGDHCGDAGDVDTKLIGELRLTFVEQLRWAYREQLLNGELDGRQAFLEYIIRQGLDFAADGIKNGQAVKDWEMSVLVSGKALNNMERLGKTSYPMKKFVCWGTNGDERVESGEFKVIRFRILLSIAIIEAHRVAERHFECKFCEKYPAEAQQVLQESAEQIALVKEDLEKIVPKDIAVVTEHLLCIILLNKRSAYLEGLLRSGLLSEKEVQGFIEGIEGKLDAIHRCSAFALLASEE